MYFFHVCDTLNASIHLLFIQIHRLFFAVPSETMDKGFTVFSMRSDQVLILNSYLR
jgi:hypothetical protein